MYKRQSGASESYLFPNCHPQIKELIEKKGHKVVKTALKLNEKCDATTIRQVFCELGNHIFQIVDSVAASKLRDLISNNDTALTLGKGAGHSENTHRMFYANDERINDDGLQKALAKALQRVLGCFYEEESTYVVDIHRDVSDETLKDCLRKLGLSLIHI